ncbi:hypothetical protein ACGFIW_10765 [Micromonospora sp. NPDC048935]|uniref:hypothetical protein n=1 Tax=Micromonospora sp. NPDC048935 TaxID=3364262 RepID=UPI0037147058
MKKIPTLFLRDPDGRKHVDGNPEGVRGHQLVPHADAERFDVPRDLDGRRAKSKRRDFA